MKKWLLMCFLLVYTISGAQVPEIDVSFKKEMIARKADHFRRLRKAERMMTANQQDYDVLYYSLDLTPNPVTSVLDGIVEVMGQVVSPTLDRVDLNFWDGMDISSIHPLDSPADQLVFTRNNDILTVHLDKTYLQGETFRFSITYSGRPEDSDYEGFHFSEYGGQPMIWTLSSVTEARGWWPCKDIPADKPDSMDIKVTVPENLIVVSNGALRETSLVGNLKTYWWHEKYPIATYLVSLAIHPYEVVVDDYVYNNGADTMEIQLYHFQGNYDANRRINDLVDDMLTCFAELFGEYPFVDEKYAQADFLWGGGMEHQTCTSYGAWNEVLYAHEIAHQWWGDMITCDDFHHIWLNEGFASYAEALWFEWAYPGYTASEYQMMYQLYLGPGTVYVEDPETENIFDSGLSYVKGSWILHMLRHVVGEDVFIDILKTYASSPLHQYGTATTEEFQTICEDLSGLNLDKFFHQWIHEELYPNYAFSWEYTQGGSGYDIELEIQQTQTHHVFWMPIDVTVTTQSGETTFVVWDSLASQTFHLNVNSEPVQITLDRNNWILKKIPDTFVNPSFDQGILLVNGVHFDTYGESIRSAYENQAFWGDFPISFWDCFNPPAAGYPANLPDPIGVGRVPGDVLGQFSTVIWVGNDYAGDIGAWQQTSIMPYLEAGGNLLLMSRKGQGYVDDELREYLGITWAEHPYSTLNNCEPAFWALGGIALTGNQTYNAVFETDLLTDESTLLFQETVSFGVPRGIGVWRNPSGGGTYRRDGGQAVFISGRPYRYNPFHLRENVEFMLTNFFNETDSPGEGVRPEIHLSQNYPNPFNPETTILFRLYQSSPVTLQIYNVMGEKVRTLIDRQTLGPGQQNMTWDGTDDKGNRVSAGIYMYQLRIPGEKRSKKMVLFK